MSITLVKYWTRVGPRVLRPPFQNILRMTGCDKPQEPCLSKCAEPCGPSTPPPPCAPPPTPPSAASSFPEPPPCAPMPTCPPSICPPIVDSNNPCNYCPPPCIDPNYPDLTKLKKLQCFFQTKSDLPTYLRRGNSDAFLLQLTVVLTLVSLLGGFYSAFVKTST